MGALKHLNKYLLKYKWTMLLGLVITAGARIAAVYVPKFVGNSTDVIQEYINGEITSEALVREKLVENILIIVGFALLSALLTFLMRQTFIVASRRIEYDLKNEVYRQYQDLSLSFYKRNRTGDLMNRISEDVTRVRFYLGPALMNTVSSVTMFFVVLVFMFSTAPVLTLYTIIPFPILSFAIYKLSKVINRRSTVVQEYLSKLSTITQESFSGISVIKSYGMEDRVNSDFNNLANSSRDKNVHLAQVQAIFMPLMALLIGVSNIIVIYIGGQQYIDGDIKNVGTIVEFLLYVNMLTWPVASVGWIANMVQRAEASQERINEFLKEEPEIKNKITEHSEIKGHIKFNRVNFTYADTGIHALKDLSFEVKNGESLAIIGKTGAGKSTILELIGRLYDIDKGALEIDGIPIDKLNLDDLRDSIGFVPQDAFLFSDSIENNIKFGKPDASEKEVQTAAKNAAVHDNILNFSQQYETVLGERGITLSGGQKQRVSIARAIIKNPQILLFDDCLSAVDTETEEEILKNLSSVSNQKTTIIVSHRVSSAKNADKVIVLDDGKLIQQGKHDELINQAGYYRELFLKQLSEKDD